MSTGSHIYNTYRFHIEMKGITEATFSECSGLQAELEFDEVVEGGLNEYVHKLPGRVKPFGNLVLKRGIASTELWKWYYDVVQGKVQRQSISIIIYGYVGAPQIRWDITGALPIKWSGPTLKSDGSEVAFETIELIHQGFKRVQ